MTTDIINAHINHNVLVDAGNYTNNLTVTPAGEITGGRYGVSAYNFTSNPNIVNEGVIDATDAGINFLNYGSVTNSGDVYGGVEAVQLSYGGNLNNSGTLSGGNTTYGNNAGLDSAVYAGFTGFGPPGLVGVENSGLITGKVSGLSAGNADVVNSGRIYGVLTGADLGRGSFYNSGTISGSILGMAVNSGTLSNAGTIHAVAAALVILAGTATNEAAGQITGDIAGVILHPTAGSATLLTNDGTITAADTAIYASASSVINLGTIADATTGIYLASGYAANAGIINASSYGVNLQSGALVADGQISGGTTGVYLMSGALTAEGEISGASYAVYAEEAIALNIAPSAIFNGAVRDAAGSGVINLLAGAGELQGLGVNITGFSTFNLAAGASWTLEGTTAGLTDGQIINGFTYGDAIILSNFAAQSVAATGGALVLANAGQTETLTYGGALYLQNFSVTNNGVTTSIGFAPIGGNNLITTLTRTQSSEIVLGGPVFSAQLTISNTGVVHTPFENAVSLNGANDTLANAGTIWGQYLGVDLESGTLENTGSIYSPGEASVKSNASYVKNTGVIASESYGIIAENGAVISNSGTISGARAIEVANGATIINSGTIATTYEAPFVGYAILGSGYMNLIIEPGAVFGGNVRSVPGDIINLAGAAPGTLDMGSSILAYGTIAFDAGAAWTLEGTAAGFAAAQAISGFAFTDTIILDNVVATKDTFVPGTGLILGGETINFTNLPANSAVEASAYGGNTTLALVPLISTIFAPLTAEVTPGAGDDAAAITVSSTGTLTGPAGTAIYASAAGAALTNAGTISGVVEFENAAQITNTGTITGAFGLALHAGGNVTDSGSISGAFAAIENSAGNLNLTLEPGAAFKGAVIDTPGNGTLTLAGDSPGSIDLGTSFTGFSDIGFAGNWTLEAAADVLANGESISGFAPGDMLVLDHFAATSQAIGAGGLTLSNGASTETINIAGISQFTVTDNANGGTDVSVACFCRGTRISTPRGNIPIENLNIGDLVTTMHGPQPIKWIGRRAYAARFISGNLNVLPIRIRRHAIALNVPSRDLYVSPDHAIAEGGVLIHARLLQNGISIHQPDTAGDIDYFHLEFDTHTLLFAENISTESFIDEGAGNRFQNSHTRPPGQKPQKPCLPRVLEGFHLHNIKSRIASRAGIQPPTSLGGLLGVIDECASTLIRGWAQNSAAPEHPVTLEIISRSYNRVILANAFRSDLRNAGLGSGCHGFSLPLPNLAGPITVRRIPDGAILPPLRPRHASESWHPRLPSKKRSLI